LLRKGGAKNARHYQVLAKPRHRKQWTGRKTGTYEGRHIDEADIQKALRQFWAKAQHLGAAHIDHFWMYADKDRKRLKLIDDQNSN